MSRRRGPPNYQSTLDGIVNQLISILLTEEFLSTSGSLHPDFNNNEDPCCDSTAVTALSGRDRELAPRFEWRPKTAQLSLAEPWSSWSQPRIEHHSGTKLLSPNCSTTTELRWSYLNAFKLPIGADGMNSAGLSVGSLLFPGFAKFQVFWKT